MMKPLSERVALVTGASSGIGTATALALSEAGVAVALTARRIELLDALADRIIQSGGKAQPVSGDISDEGFATGLVERVVEAFGSIDILVNSAGTIQSGLVEGCDFTEWRRTMDINFFASLYTTSAAFSHMKEQAAGDIIQISSTGGRRPTPTYGSYGPSKHALNAMSRAFRTEAGAHGVRVCMIEPGATTSGIYEGMTDPSGKQAMQDHIHKEGAMKPEDIAAMIVSIVSLPQRANVEELLIRPTIDIQSM